MMAASMLLILSFQVLGANVDGASYDLTRGPIALVVLIWAAALAVTLMMRSTQRLADRMEKFAPKFHEAFARLGLDALEGDALGPASMKPNPPAKQVSAGSESVEALMARAAALGEPFHKRLIEPLSRAGGRVDMPRHAMWGVKGGPRTYEKVRLDYNGDCTLLKDLLRGCIICPTIEDLCTVFARFRDLSLKGVCVIVQIKNRYRDGQAPSGYADINLVVDFEGHLCEVQLLLEDFYTLKNEQTPICTVAHVSNLPQTCGPPADLGLMSLTLCADEFCRSLGLIGTLPPAAPARTTVSDLSCFAGLAVISLRLAGGCIAAMIAGCYMCYGLTKFTFDSAVNKHWLPAETYATVMQNADQYTINGSWIETDLMRFKQFKQFRGVLLESRVDRVPQTIALAIPYLIVSFVTFRDLFRFLKPAKATAMWLVFVAVSAGVWMISPLIDRISGAALRARKYEDMNSEIFMTNCLIALSFLPVISVRAHALASTLSTPLCLPSYLRSRHVLPFACIRACAAAAPARLVPKGQATAPIPRRYDVRALLGAHGAVLRTEAPLGASLYYRLTGADKVTIARRRCVGGQGQRYPLLLLCILGRPRHQLRLSKHALAATTLQ